MKRFPCPPVLSNFTPLSTPDPPNKQIDKSYTHILEWTALQDDCGRLANLRRSVQVVFRNGSRNFVVFLKRMERPKLLLFERASVSSVISAP